MFARISCSTSKYIRTEQCDEKAEDEEENKTHATECQNNCENEGNDAYHFENEFERAGTIWNGMAYLTKS